MTNADLPVIMGQFWDNPEQARKALDENNKKFGKDKFTILRIQGGYLVVDVNQITKGGEQIEQ